MKHEVIKVMILDHRCFNH